jgi:hypothetical protein
MSYSPPDSTEGCVTAELLDDTPVSGCSTIRVVP